ncbi:MAG: hypothetical protein AAGC60_17635 [Acidobacteriota bacterium]
MCHKAARGCALHLSGRQLRHAGGTIVQCDTCGTIGVELGTSYLVLSERGFFIFADWLASTSWETANIERGRLRVRLKDDTLIMLSLSRDDLQRLKSLVEEGMRRVVRTGSLASSGGTQSRPSLTATEGTVH